MTKVVLFTLLAANVLPGQPRALILADVSRSESARAEGSRTEQLRVLAALPDATWCELYTVGTRVNRQFQGVLDATGRAETRRQIKAEQFSEPNTALGEALQQALAVVAGSAGPNRIVLITDGQARSIPGSPYRRRSFESILAAISIPKGTELFVSLQGGSLPQVTTTRVHVLSAPPADWVVALSFPKPLSPAYEPPPAQSMRWTFAAAFAVAICFSLGLLAWKYLRSGGKIQELTACTLAEDAGPELPETSQPQQLYTITLAQRTASLACGETLLVGDSALADWYLPGTIAVVHFLHNSDAVWLENNGSSTVHVGRVPVAPRGRLKLPSQPVEIAIGRCTAFCFPELSTTAEVLQ